MTDFKLGQVVVDEAGYRGVVKYVGPVASAKNKEATWIGVEWAAKGRGKHDGSVKRDEEETRYFQCEKGQGSFVKPQFVKAGVSFPDALVERYEPADKSSSNNQQNSPSETDVEEEVLTGPRWGNGEVVTIEAVGMDMIRRKQRISNLKEVSLASSAVASAGEPGWIKATCPNIRELDLSENLIDSWATVGSFLEQLPELEHLVLARNDITKDFPPNPIEKLPTSLRRPYPVLKVLVLNRTGTTFSQIQRLDIEGVLPALEELVLGDNGLTSLDPFGDIKTDKVVYEKGTYAAWAKEQMKEVDRSGFTPESFATGFRNLLKVDVSRNKIASWSEIWRLSRLPTLRHINASENPINEVFFDKATPVDSIDVTVSPSATENTEREIAIEKFKKLELEEMNASREPKSEASAPETQDDERAKAKAGVPMVPPPKQVIDIVMSNGMAVPVVECKERARYTEARLFKGSGHEGGAQPFSSLETLLLSRTEVSSWTSVDALDHFPQLKELRVQDSPVLATVANAGAARQNCIARVHGLRRINGSEVSDRERSDAERLYLKRAAMERQSKQLSEEEIVALHPRFKKLVAIHGDPTEVAKRASEDQTNGNLAANSAKVTIKSFDPRSCTVAPASKRLPLTMTVHELKVLCQRLFKVDVDLQNLFYRETGKTFGHPTALDDDAMPIVDFGVTTGGEIIMEARDPEQDAEKEAKRAVQEAESMRAQEKQAAHQAEIKRAELEQAKSSVINTVGK
mmetsp:Transcript_9917/g.18287  ORF Transcript_9917/g.18287 Transcript_9917/m.18287 type:complete len:744 (+) Transcript_9917:283-2514(+)|eukprot:CAMPEP_0184545498 /NCGR_PEP_ID=MMETSP0199_2-20130426/4343_1 /TAXON_ID=1112570 /ORGANISM="Thraustochytrium sp., Strain LLF1b" /LENGTH=743 /DNA_ID=CAMNT_0026939803 /DNA_START=285 /DNA_END=2513 /DNA_ORIENTATION=+